LAASSKLASAVKSLATALKAGLAEKSTRAAIVDVRNRVQEYDVPDNVDLVDFCQLLRAKTVSTAIKSACDQVVAAVQTDPVWVIASGYYGAPMKHSHGVAIYFPTRDLSPLYARLDFVKKTGWGRFLEAYLASSRSR
jgi:hypothetical protein